MPRSKQVEVLVFYGWLQSRIYKLENALEYQLKPIMFKTQPSKLYIKKVRTQNNKENMIVPWDTTTLLNYLVWV